MASIRLQDLRRRLYVKAKADKDWRFWGLYVHVAKLETLQAAYDLVKRNNGAPGIDGVTFEAIEAAGVDAFLAQLRDELAARTYRPLRNRRVEIPKDDGKKVRVLGIPAIRDRVVQGALKLILEPIFEAGFHDGSYGYRPKRNSARRAGAGDEGHPRGQDAGDRSGSGRLLRYRPARSAGGEGGAPRSGCARSCTCSR